MKEYLLKLFLFTSLVLFFYFNACKNEINHPESHQPVYLSDTVYSIIGTTMIFSAKINPQGVPTTYYFEYDVSENFNNSTTSKYIGAGPNFIMVVDTVSNLESGTLYYYRLVLEYDNRKVFGSIKTFVTPFEFIYPLSIATKWLYHYKIRESAYLLYFYDRNGNHEWEVIEKTDSQDSTIYKINCVQQDTIHEWNSLGTFDTTYTIHRLVQFKIVVYPEYIEPRWYSTLKDTYHVSFSYQIPRFSENIRDSVKFNYGNIVYVNNYGLTYFHQGSSGMHSVDERLYLQSIWRR
jgi:hypothetical protein